MTTNPRSLRPAFPLSKHPFVLGACLFGLVAGCGRDLVIGIDGIDIHPGSDTGTGGSSGAIGSGGFGGVAGSGGAIGSGGFGGVAGSGGAIGSGGSGGVGGPISEACQPISTTPGTMNACGRTTGVALSPDGTLLAAVTQKGGAYLHVWRLSDGSLVQEPPDAAGSGDAYSVTFSPDGALIATAGVAPGNAKTNTVHLWNTATGALVRTLPTQCGSYASGLAFSHDGARLATGGAQNQIEIWNVATGARMLSIPYAGSVYAAHFSADDTRLITTSYLVATVWDPTTGKKLMEITGLEDEMNEAVFSPDDQMILTTAELGKVKVLTGGGALLQTLAFHAESATPYFSHAAWVGNDAFVVDDWSGAVKEFKANASGSFALAQSWTLDTQALGMAVSPDHKTLVVGGDSGFFFLAL